MTPAAMAGGRASRDARGARRARERVAGTGARLRRERFAAVHREHGPDSVAFYVSGQLLTEDYYVFNKLAKGLIGTPTSTPTRACACPPP
jgi:assimilatory nitrate reductase catalytic subunit